MTIIASDGGLLAYPVSVETVGVSVGERWEIIVDFAPYKGQNITMMNVPGIDIGSDYNNTDKIMRKYRCLPSFVASTFAHLRLGFIVGDTVHNDENNGHIPHKLRDVPFPPNNTVDDREFLFALEGGEWRINGVTW